MSCNVKSFLFLSDYPTGAVTNATRILTAHGGPHPVLVRIKTLFPARTLSENASFYYKENLRKFASFAISLRLED